MRELVVWSTGRAVATGTTSTVVSAGLIFLESFAALTVNLVAGAPVLVLFVVALAGISVYRGRTLGVGTALLISLMMGTFVGIIGMYELVTAPVLPFLVVSGLLLGLLFGGLGSLVDAVCGSFSGESRP